MNQISKTSLLIVGASGVGKGTIINNLKERYPNTFEHVLSFTTRKIRHSQTHGVHYYFVTREQFLKRIPQMLQHKLVHQNWYGTSRAHLQYIHHIDKIPILDVDIEGMLQIRQKINCKVLCLMPPSFQLLKSRLQNRKENSPEQIEHRMKQNYRQVTRMLALSGLPDIYFTTNYQYQLTNYGIQKWLQSNFDKFKKHSSNQSHLTTSWFQSLQPTFI